MHRRVLASIAACVVLSAAAACASTLATPTETGPAGRLRVATTLYPMTFFAEQVGGRLVEVTGLIRPGTSPHTFEPSPSDVLTLQSAAVIVYNSGAFETWIDDALDAMDTRQRIVVEAADLDVSFGEEHDHGAVDPHVWLDPIQAMAQVERIRDAFVEADPDGAGAYRVGAAALVERLAGLHDRFSTALRGCSHRTFIVNHRAFGHLAQRYGLDQVAISGPEPQSEPGPRSVAAIAGLMKDRGIRHVLAEPIVSSDIAETIAREVGGEVLILHPLGALTPDELDAGEDYFSIMEANLHTLTIALDCPAPSVP